MKNKFWYLIRQSLSRKINTKWFKIVNFILCIAIVAIFNIDSIINAFGGDFNQKTEIYVIDNTDIAYDLFKEQMDYNNTLVNEDGESAYVIEKYDNSIEEARKIVEDDKNKIFIEFNNSLEDVLSITMLSKEYIDLANYTVLNTALNGTKSAIAMIKFDIDASKLQEIYSPVKIDRIFLDENKTSTDENMEAVVSTVFPVVILPFFMLSMLLVQMIGAEVNDEKTTRGMEIIIANVDPKVHLASKVISGNLFVLFQSFLLICFAAIGFIIRKYTGGSSIVNGLGTYLSSITEDFMTTSLISKLSYIIPLMLILIILTFIAYSLAAGILASMSTNIEDFQQVQTPIMGISLVGFYLSMLAGMFKGSLFIKIISYVPFISAILSPSLLILGQISLVDVFIAIALMVILLYLLIKYGIRIYKVGILNYSSKDIWKKMFKAIKEKN